MPSGVEPASLNSLCTAADAEFAADVCASATAVGLGVSLLPPHAASITALAESTKKVRTCLS
jgi:hypothetical protein